MKKIIIAFGLFFVSSLSFASISCSELQSQIESKLERKGVKNFTLQVLDKEAESTFREVGQCNGGKKKIIYKKESKSQQKLKNE